MGVWLVLIGNKSPVVFGDCLSPQGKGTAMVADSLSFGQKLKKERRRKRKEKWEMERGMFRSIMDEGIG